MSEFRCVVVKIGKIEKHANADRLALTYIDSGYPCVFRLDELKEGDLAIYCSVDSVVPTSHPKFAFFNRPDKKPKPSHRVRAEKYRGVFSMGLLLKADPGMEEGQDVKDILGVTKYEPPEEYAILLRGEDEKDPGYINTYTDIEGFRKYSKLIQDGEEVVVTEKIHGCLRDDQHISMADGSKKQIRDVLIGDRIFGVDAFGRIVPTRIINKFNNGTTKHWLKITYTMSNVNGYKMESLTCTPDHEIYSLPDDEYRKASSLSLGSGVALFNKAYDCTDAVKSVTGNFCIPQDIISIETIEEEEERWDLETETHNYFANGILIHNCNARFVYNDNRLWVGSRTRIKRSDSDTVWWRVAKNLDLENRLKNYPGIVIYGEVYGQVQNLKYGKTDLDLALFDAMDMKTRRYFDFDDFADLVKKLDLPTAPLLYRGQWKDELKSMADGMSTIPNANHIREGVVIKPVKEKYDPKIGRVILKLIGEQYLLMK